MYTVDMHAWWTLASSLFTRYMLLSYNRVTAAFHRQGDTDGETGQEPHRPALGSVKGRSHNCSVQLAG